MSIKIPVNWCLTWNDLFIELENVDMCISYSDAQELDVYLLSKNLSLNDILNPKDLGYLYINMDYYKKQRIGNYMIIYKILIIKIYVLIIVWMYHHF